MTPRKKVPRKTCRNPQPRPRMEGYQEWVLATRQTLRDAIVGQDHVLDTLVGIAAATQFRSPAAKVPNPRLLLVGPSSSGKTHIALTIAKILGIPTVTINAATCTPDGYRGSSFTDALRSLVNNAFGEPTRNGVIAPCAIVIIEELDKILLKTIIDDGFAASALHSLLPLWGGEQLLVEEEGISSVPMNTSEIVVIATGVFEGIPKSAWESLETSMKALSAYGISKELLNRLTHLIALHPPDTLAQRQILYKQAEAFGLSISNDEVDFQISEPTLFRIEREIAAGGLGLRHSLMHFHMIYSSILRRWEAVP